MTINPPKGTGYYWWTNGGEHTPTIVEVSRSCYSDNKMCFSDGNYLGVVSENPVIRTEPEDEDETPVFTHEGVEYYYGSELWSEVIELPEIDGEFVLPDSF